MTRGGESFLLQEETKWAWFLESSKMQAGKRYICCLQIPQREVPGREKSYLSERAALAQEQAPKNLPGIHFSWKLEEVQEVHFWNCLPGGFIGTKIPTCFDAEVRQFFTDTTATPNSRGLGNMIQKVPFSPIFHRPHLSISFNNLRFCTNGIQLPWDVKAIWFSLFSWLEELTAEAWYCPLATFHPVLLWKLVRTIPSLFLIDACHMSQTIHHV